MQIILATTLALLLSGALSVTTPTLRWSDEFNYPSIDPASWGYDIGDGSAVGIPGWGNNELECYTSSSSNSYTVKDPKDKQNRLLAIVAKNEGSNYNCYNGANNPPSKKTWSSARLNTWGRRTFMPPAEGGAIKIEARIQFPMNKGTWPAFWALPQPVNSSGNDYGWWCSSGEIDILEHVNSDTTVNSNIFFKGTSGGASWEGCMNVPASKDLGSSVSGFHTYGIVWAPTYIANLVDGVEYRRIDKSQWAAGSTVLGVDGAPFNRPFFLLLNLAIGGNWPGDPTQTGPFTMFVDWVRVWDVPL